MQIAATRLQRSRLIVFSRILGVALILTTIGIDISLLAEHWNDLQHHGLVQDVYHTRRPDGKSVVDYVSAEATLKGIVVGDTILNPEADSIGEIGTSVALQVQQPNGLVRQVAFERKPANFTTYGGILSGLSVETSTALSLLTTLLPLLLGSIAALVICWLKSDNWMAVLTALMLVTVNSFPHSTDLSAVILRVVSGPLLFVWILLFPNGRFAPRWSWMFLLFVLPTIVLSALLDLGLVSWSDTLQIISITTRALAYVAVLGIILVPVFRFRRVFSPTERQQTKWIITAFVFLLLPLFISGGFYEYYWGAGQMEKGLVAYFINSCVGAVGISILILSVLFAVFRYRLYDVDVFISRAIVYSSLTGILATVGFAATVSIDYFLREVTGNQSGLIAAVISAAPIAALFNPVRERLQKAVDRRFKQEEIDFENTFIEFSAGLNSLFTKEELSTLLCEHAVEQLNISHASVFLNEKNTGLKPVKTVAVEKEASHPVLDSKTFEELSKGRLTSPEGDSAQSLVIPLVVPRSRKPTLLGALVLGRRLHGLGYSSSMLERLKKFGEEVGKAFYVAEVREKKKG